MRRTKNDIVRGLRNYLNIDVVPTDTTDRKPEYPYVSYKIISMLDSNTFSRTDGAVESDNPNFAEDIQITRKEQTHFTISINVYSTDEDEARDFSVRTADWFGFLGYSFLSDINIVVVNVGSISDRTQQIVDDYERRFGFDVRLRMARSTTKRAAGIERHSL